MFKKKQEPKPSEIAMPQATDTSEINRDKLTSPDPAYCMEYMDKIFAQKKPKGAVAKVYLENFKLINDTFGYKLGERMLENIFSYLKSLDKVQILRYGGVEFLIILDRFDYTSAVELLGEIRNRFEETWCIDNMEYMCDVSMGAAFYPEKADNAQGMIRILEYAVTQATQTGQNRYVLFDSALQNKIARRHSIANLLSQVQSMPKFVEVRYRPTFDAKRRRFTRAECYARILSPDYGPIQSQEYIPIAEDTGIICKLNIYVIECACEEIHRLMEKNVDFESIAVRISPVQFLQNRFVDDIKEMLAKHQIPAEKLALEITESVLVNAFGRVSIVMQELSELGIELILNEFGTGYSGINNILDLPINVVKLERMFVLELETNPKSRFLIEGLIHIANNLGLKLIAEGVETQNQVECLAKYGCQYAQGFYYAPTLTAEELEKHMSVIKKATEVEAEAVTMNM